MKIRVVAVLVLLIIMVVNVNAQTELTLPAVPLNSLTLSKSTDEKFTAYKILTGADLTPDNQVWIYDSTATKAKMLSSVDKVEGNAYSDSASISDDGTKAVFHSWSSNLAAVPDCANVFFKDVKSEKLEVIKDHALSPAISADGRYIVYEYNPDPEHGLPGIYRYTISTDVELFIGFTSLGNTKGGWYFPHPQISKDGGVITYTTTISGKPEVYQWREGRKPEYLRDGVLA